jgi:hypothetical protein
MIKKSFWTVLIFGIAAWSVAYADAVNISNSAAESVDASVAINSSGEVGVVWVERFAGGGQYVYFSRYSGGRWSTPAEIPGQSGNSINPRIAKGLGGGFAAAWHDVTFSCIRCSQYNGSWSTPVTVSQVGGYDLGWPSIATTGNRIAVGWMRGNPTNLDIFVAIYHGGWSEPVNVANTAFSSKYCDIAASPDGEFHVVFQDNLWINQTDFFATMITTDRGSNNWTQPEIIDNLGAWTFRPFVAVNSGGQVFSAFYYLQASSFWSVYYMSGGWQAAQQVSDVGDHHDHDRYFGDACGFGSNGFLFGYRDVGYNVAYAVVQNGALTNNVTLTSSYGCYHPSLDYSPGVGGVATWTQDKEIFALFFDPEGGSTIPTPTPVTVVQPPIGVEADYFNIPLAAPNVQTDLVVNRHLFTVQDFRKLTWDVDGNWSSWGITLAKYRVYRRLLSGGAWEAQGEVPASQLMYVDKNGVTQEDRFEYQVRGVDTFGNEYFAYNWIRWAPNPLNTTSKIVIASYNVYRKTSGQSSDSYVLWRSVSAETNSQEDYSAEIRQNTKYDYAVSAVSDKGKESTKAEAVKVYITAATRARRE